MKNEKIIWFNRIKQIEKFEIFYSREEFETKKKFLNKTQDSPQK